MPAWPKTRLLREARKRSWRHGTSASSGFETTIRIASGLLVDDLLGDVLDDLLVRRHEVVAAHARRAGEAGG